MLHINQAVLLEFRQRAAHCFQFQPQIAADFLARHPQNKIVCRKTAHIQTIRQIQQKHRQPLFRPHIAQKQHHRLVTHNLAAHQAQNVQIKLRDFLAQLVDLVKWQLAHLAVFQRHRVASIFAQANPVRAHQFARHKKTRNLVAPVLRAHRRFEKPRADGKQRSERFPRMK